MGRDLARLTPLAKTTPPPRVEIIDAEFQVVSAPLKLPFPFRAGDPHPHVSGWTWTGRFDEWGVPTWTLSREAWGLWRMAQPVRRFGIDWSSRSLCEMTVTAVVMVGAVAAIVFGWLGLAISLGPG